MRHISALVATLAIAGCGQPNYNGMPLGRPDGGVVVPVTNAPAASTNPDCSSTGPVALAPVDPSTLTACGDQGDAHCLGSDKVPAVVAAQLAACPNNGGFCVPDSFLTSGGAAPPTCKSLNSADGVCLSVSVPQVAQYKDLLPQATCAATERCAPCVNPLTSMPSGACDIGKPGAANPGCVTGGADGGAPVQPVAPMCPHMGAPVLDPASLPSCYAGGGAHCIQTALVPPALASQLAMCATGLCAPDVAIESAGQYIPLTCDSLKGAEGRCTHVAIPAVDAQKDFLPQAVCQTYERCVPCSSPIDGKDTGACHIACDPGPSPSRPPVVFQNCCQLDNNSPTTYGKCVPKSAVPASMTKYLKQKECSDATEVCAPTENLVPGPPPKACSANNFFIGKYTGVCLSKCLGFGLQSLGISKGNCDDQHECVPCTQNGTPTGAPGCPGPSPSPSPSP